jgi:hypothetical protein
MRQETYRFALDEATAELGDIVTQFEQLKAKKEQIEKVVEALKPFIGLQAQAPAVEISALFTAPEIEQPAPQPAEFTFMQISGPGMEITKTEPVPVEVVAEPVPELVLAGHDETSEQVAYFRQPSADPFQRRIDDALWGWQQRPEGLLSPI